MIHCKLNRKYMFSYEFSAIPGFIQKHTLTVHMRLHNGETPYVCEICSKGYRSKSLLQQHMYKHNDIKMQTVKYQRYYLKYGKVKVECKVCQKIITKSALYNHMKVQHGDGLKNFLCNLCGKTYATKMSLGEYYFHYVLRQEWKNIK